jgi:hypothetical protein
MTLVESTAMTDNDDPAPPRGDPSSGVGKDELGKAGVRSGKNDAIDRARIRGASARIAPTDPEVPSAKRRWALRDQRSLVGLTAVVMGLLSITLALLYRASQQVRTRDGTTGDAAGLDTRSERSAATIEHGQSSTRADPNSASPAKSDGELGDQTPSDDGSNDNAPAASGTLPKAPPPARDIIRTPTF